MVEQVEIKSILEKFSNVNYPDYKEVEKELSILKTISEKLDHLLGLKNDYYDRFQEIKNKLSEAESDLFFENEGAILKSVFGAEKLLTPLYIPEPIFNKHFKVVECTTEYRYWFLQYMAQKRFDQYINSKIYRDSIELNFTKNLQNELDKILAIEKKAFRLQRKERINALDSIKNVKGFLWTGEHLDFVKKKSHEGNSVDVLRVHMDYYKKYPTKSLYDWASKEVDAYFRHILLKSHLENLLHKKVSVNTLALIAFIKQETGQMDKLLSQKEMIAYGESLGVSGNSFKNFFSKIRSAKGELGFSKKHFNEAISVLGTDEKGKAWAIKTWGFMFE